MDKRLLPETENPLLALRLQRSTLPKTTAHRLGYLDLSHAAIIVDLIAQSEVGPDPELKAEARRALLRYVRAIGLPPESAYVLPVNVWSWEARIAAVAIISWVGWIGFGVS